VINRRLHKIQDTPLLQGEDADFSQYISKLASEVKPMV
jgi:hypothetical protein